MKTTYALIISLLLPVALSPTSLSGRAQSVGGAPQTVATQKPQPQGTSDLPKLIIFKGKSQPRASREIPSNAHPPEPLSTAQKQKLLSETPRELALQGNLSADFTLSPQQPYVASKGWLDFNGVLEVIPEQSKAFSSNQALTSGYSTASVQVTIHGAASTLYLIDCSVFKSKDGGPYKIDQPDGSTAWVPPSGPQHLELLLFSETPSNYTYTISAGATDNVPWVFFGCEVTKVS